MIRCNNITVLAEGDDDACQTIPSQDISFLISNNIHHLLLDAV